MDEIYDFCVIITTYNRPDMLIKLLENISEQKKDYKILVTVFDDCSTYQNIMLEKSECLQIWENKNIISHLTQHLAT
jgi:glycosyltransferase involved in cell wall biosynthesis